MYEYISQAAVLEGTTDTDHFAESWWYKLLRCCHNSYNLFLVIDKLKRKYNFKCTLFILHEIRKRKANWIGHILRRNCLLQQVIEGKIKGQIEVTRRRGRMRKKLLDDLKARRGYCQLKEEALDRTMWRNRFGRGFGPVVWQITDDDDDDIYIYMMTLRTGEDTVNWRRKL
jgi:hypothetical protein